MPFSPPDLKGSLDEIIISANLFFIIKFNCVRALFWVFACLMIWIWKVQLAAGCNRTIPPQCDSRALCSEVLGQSKGSNSSIIAELFSQRSVTKMLCFRSCAAPSSTLILLDSELFRASSPVILAP